MPRNVLPEALLVVLVRSDVNEVLPPVECVLGDGGIATLVTIFSVPSVPENNHCTADILEMDSNSTQRRPRPSSSTKIKFYQEYNQTESLRTMAYCTSPPHERSTCSTGGITTGSGKRSAWRKICPITLQRTINSIGTTKGLNQGLREEMPVTNILIYTVLP